MRRNVSAVALAAMMAYSGAATTQGAPPTTATSKPADKTFSQPQLDQILAPIALYPDSLLTQTLMASTYPLEIVQAQRWMDANKTLKGDALATELEKQTWDPSVKSLVNFPQVVQMLNEKLDWTVQLGDAFLAQQKDVLDTVQKLRAKAEAQGNLKSTAEQKVVTTDSSAGTQTIVIESASPEVIYVPTYNPTVIYGSWPYPTYPPYYYYPPAYTPSPGIAFGAGLAVGVAWGYAWGHCNWGGSNVDIDVNRNTNINTNINREKYKSEINNNRANVGNTRANGGSGASQWQHNPSHRGGTPYPNKTTSQQFGNSATQARDSYRGFDNQSAGSGAGKLNGLDRSGSSYGDSSRTGGSNLQSSGSNYQSSGSNTRNQAGSSSRQDYSGTRSSAFDGVDRSAAQTRAQSDRGQRSSSGSTYSGSASRGGGGSAARSGGSVSRGGGGGGGRRR